MLNRDQYTSAYLNTINESNTFVDIDYEKNIKIAEEIGGIYDVESNTIDCRNHQVRFKNSWLNANGSFDFKLINTITDYDNMFHRCTELRYLPKHFTIPEGVTTCGNMFYSCVSLTHLPENFRLPSTINWCDRMFLGCINLRYLPEQFMIPVGATNCEEMFGCCQSLMQLPRNFTIPNTINDCDYMFYGCKSLIEIPQQFTIPIDCSTYDIFGGCDNLPEYQKNIEQYRMLEI